MTRTLLFRLLGAFALVILVLAFTVSFLASRTTAGQFRLYTDRSDRLWAERLAPALADYYAEVGTWQGVGTIVQSPMGSGGMGMGMMGPGGGPSSGANMWAMMGQRLIVADSDRRVVFDSATTLAGQALSAQELAEGVPITTGNRQVGTVVVAEARGGTASPAGEFLASVNRSIWLAATAAGLIALGLGALFFFQLTAPLRQLTIAAHAIASGDLSRRVSVRSRDELGELASAFNAMADELARAEEQRRQMVADVAHELRTPISVLQANLEAMQDGVLPLDAGQVASLQEETLVLARLVADLRFLSLADTGQLKLQRSELDLGDLLRKAVDRLNSEAQTRDITLQVTVPSEPMPIFVDPDRINQVIANLVGNALRYAPSGSEVEVAAKPTGGRPAFVVSVTDSGPGIPPADLPNVFDRFYRADKSRTRASGGSGLGLAIVRSLVEAHGGTVWVESPVFYPAGSPGYGTRFSFTV